MSDANGRATRRRRFTVDDLFRDTSAQAVGVQDLRGAKEIRLERIGPDPNQPRRTFDEERLQELAASIRREGVLQPIAVRYEAEHDRYVVLHGERRWRAANLAGLETIPAIVREVPPERRLIQQLMENVVREDLNALDRAGALRALKQQMDDAPWERVAEAVGIRRSRLFQLLGTEKLADSVQAHIRAGRLSEKQSRVLQGLREPAQEVIATLIVDEGLGSQVAQRLARAARNDAELVELDATELLERFRTMRQSLEAPSRRDRRPANGSRTSAAEAHRSREVADPGMLVTTVEDHITSLAAGLERLRQASPLDIDRQARLERRLRELQDLIGDFLS